MTEAEFTSLRDQVTLLQQQAESRAKAWRPIGTGLRIFAIGYGVAAFGFFIAGIWIDAATHPSTHQFTQMMGFMLLFISIPLSLILQLLRTP